MLNTLITFTLCIGTFAYFDRFCGGGAGWHRGTPGRPIYYVLAAILASVPVFYFLPSNGGVDIIRYLLLALAWLAWRWPGWRLFGGSLAPRGAREVWGTAARHSILFLAVFNAVPMSQMIYGAAGVAMLVASYTFMHVQIRQASLAGKDIIPAVELTRGALYGAFVFCVLNI